jgi:hypothetical protein
LGEIIDLRKALVTNGFWPVPVKGKLPRIKDWTKFRPSIAQIQRQAEKHADHTGTGIVTGEVVALDIDAPDPETAAALTAIADRLPGADRALRRVGRAPKLLLMFRATEPRKKISTEKYRIGDHDCQVEILGQGQQFASFGDHPDTGKPYEWLTQSPLEVPLADLPEITPETIDAFVAEAGAYLAEHGVPLKEKRTKVGGAPSPAGSNPWDRINAAAMANLDAWVPHLSLAKLRRYQDGYLAVASFRPSKNPKLGPRDRQEALEIQPAGICDHGDGDKGYSPISLVRACSLYGAKDAFAWLTTKLGKAPADFGWEDYSIPRMRSGGTRSYEAANDNEPLLDDDEDVVDAGALAEEHGFPVALCYPPGAVGRFTRFIESCSRFPSPHLSLAAALALTAGLIGRRYKGPTGLRSNLYVVGLADSGFGKDITIRATAALADSTSAGTKVSEAMFVDEIRSVPGLAGRLRNSPSAVAVIDEFGKWLGTHTGSKVPPHREEIITAILALTGAPSGFWGGRETAAGNIPRIEQPCFTIHGVSTPTTFWKALSSGNISEGLLGRFVLIDAGKADPVKVRRPAGSLDDIPEDLADDVNALLGGGSSQFGGGPFYALHGKSDSKPWPIMTVEYAEGVEDLFENFDDVMRAKKAEFSAEYRPLLNRVGENAARLAMIVAVGVNPKEPVITAEIQEWANTVAEHSFRTIVSGADDNVADNEKSGEYLRIKAMVRKTRGKGITRKLMLKTLRGSLDSRRFDDITNLLHEAGEVFFATAKSESGQKMIRYWSREHLPADAEIIPPGAGVSFE